SVGANNDTYTVAGQDATNQITISGTFADEAAGATVRVSPGESMAHDNVAVSFVPATSWLATHVAVKVRAVNSPSDSFRIGIYPDSSGAPGTVIQAKETLGSLLFTELTWTEFEFATPVSLVGGTTYWLGLRRTGTANPDDGYEIAIDEDLGYAGGVLRVYNGVSWAARDPNSDMPFRIIGEIDSSEQIEKAIAVVDDFDGSLVQVTSGIPVRQFVEDERTVMEEITTMLDSGTASGLRLVAWVTRDDVVVVGTEDSNGYGETNPVLDQDGKLHYGAGGFFPPGILVYGRHVELAGLHLLAGMGAGGVQGASIYVAGSEYNAASDVVTITSLGALDPFQALVSIQKG
ncbi:MAG: choice-of-anchor R domain-containing protein, partial [Rhodanobacter sp.]